MDAQLVHKFATLSVSSNCTMRSPQPQSPSALTEPPSSRESSCFFEPGVFSISADSDGDGCTEASYGVHCLLHDAGTVEPVIISSLYTHTDASSDDEVVEVCTPPPPPLWRTSCTHIGVYTMALWLVPDVIAPAGSGAADQSSLAFTTPLCDSTRWCLLVSKPLGHTMPAVC